MKKHNPHLLCWYLLLFCRLKLVGGSDGAHGAGAGASAAVDASTSVDLHVIVTHGNSAHGASGLAGAAGHAGVIDCMCHVKYTSIIRVRTILIVA